jgi:hypothetical protein
MGIFPSVHRFCRHPIGISRSVTLLTRAARRSVANGTSPMVIHLGTSRNVTRRKRERRPDKGAWGLEKVGHIGIIQTDRLATKTGRAAVAFVASARAARIGGFRTIRASTDDGSSTKLGGASGIAGRRRISRSDEAVGRHCFGSSRNVRRETASRFGTTLCPRPATSGDRGILSFVSSAMPKCFGFFLCDRRSALVRRSVSSTGRGTKWPCFGIFLSDRVTAAERGAAE